MQDLGEHFIGRFLFTQGRCALIRDLYILSLPLPPYISYIQYSSICARFLRRALKPQVQAKEIAKSEETTIRAFKWKDGKPGDKSECHDCGIGCT